MALIEVRSLSKSFRARVRASGFGASFHSLFKPQWRVVEAVKEVSFEVGEGEAVAFLGPNGAGKSTTIKMLTGILEPTGGQARVLSLDPSRRRTQLATSIGTVFGQKSQLWFHLPPSDSFALLAAVYELPRELFLKRRDELVDRFGIGPWMDVPVRKLSLGERIRCEVAASLLHAPRILFLDEPTIGLDVVAKRELRSLLEELRKREGTTLFLTSHDVGDIEKVCKRAIIIHHGSVVVDESMKELRHRALSKKRIGVKYGGPVDLELPGLSPVKRTADAASFEIDTRSHNLPELIAALAGRGELLDLTVEDEPLEDIIAEVFRGGNAEEARAAARATARARGGLGDGAGGGIDSGDEGGRAAGSQGVATGKQGGVP
ncbi:MAG TPA: ATP-binding cassette domain-containing protein [Rectinemataceae bacterium]|nr:ATP-binding cassette domain-containing protein [Rectinemataceae bacterium]